MDSEKSTSLWPDYIVTTRCESLEQEEEKYDEVESESIEYSDVQHGFAVQQRGGGLGL